MDTVITEITDSAEVIRALATECADFATLGFLECNMGPEATRAAATMSHHVEVRLRPMRAVLVCEAGNGDLRVAYRAIGHEVPSELSKASAAFVAVAIAQLSNTARANLLQLQNHGAALSVLVSRDDGTAALMVQDGTAEPQVVCKFDAQMLGTLH